jgi:cell wall-associated NlpC family hydrolase
MGALVPSFFDHIFAEREKSRRRVCDIARTWLNTPYHPEARVKGAGCDCATLLVEVYEEAGLLPHLELEHYPQDWHMHRSEELYLKQVLQYAHEVESPAPGDVCLWKIGRTFSHGAIVLAWPSIIHAVVGRGVLYGDASNDADLIGRELRFYSPWA